MERVRTYFDQHPDVSKDDFLHDALLREIDFREHAENRKVEGIIPRQGEGHRHRSTIRWPLSNHDLRVHSELAERLAEIHYQRYGLWPKLRRFLFG